MEEFAGMVEECWAQGAPGILADWVSEFGMAEELWEQFKRVDGDRTTMEISGDYETINYICTSRRLWFLEEVLNLVFLPCPECQGKRGVWCTRCRQFGNLRLELPREECRECHGTAMELDGQDCLVCRGHGTVVK